MTSSEASTSDSTNSIRPLRVGVLCDGDELAAWQADCLSKVASLDFAEIVLFVCHHQPQAHRHSAWRRLREKLGNGLLLWRIYERAVLNRRARASRSVPIPSSLSHLPRMQVQPTKIGKFRQAFSSESLEAISKYDLDVLLRFGFSILTGEILEVPRHGVWSFHHGDPQHFRGAPPGFWEIHNGEPVTGVILQRLTETLDGGVVLHAGWFKTNHANYPKSLDRTLFGATHFVARALRDLRNNPEDLMRRTPLQNSGPIYRYPKTRAMLTFLRKTGASKVYNQYLSLFRHQQWSVGLLDETPEAIFASLSGGTRRAESVKWLPEPSGGFLADPFAVQVSGEAMVIAEEFDWRTGLGRIATVPFTSTRRILPDVVIRSDRHLSYPYIFGYGPETYCVPECATSNGVLLYRLVPGANRWTKHKKIIDGFPALDPTIFFHEGRWWLFCTSAETGPNEVLYAWFAHEPTGDWRPHPQNPLKVDVRSARPAGRPFMSDGRLIRPAQDCSHRYGGAVTFNRILKLTSEEFREEPAGQLLPDSVHYPAGLHTISGFGEKSVIDGARLTFASHEFWRSARNTLARVQS